MKRNTIVLFVVLLILAIFGWAGWANWEYRQQAAEKRARLGGARANWFPTPRATAASIVRRSWASRRPPLRSKT